MTKQPFDRIADAFMATGPVVLPDRVLDAAFEEVHRTRQRRVLRRVPWRFPTMNTYAKVAVAAVAVIAIGFLGLNVLRPTGTGSGGAPEPSPSPSVAPTPSAPPSPTPAPEPTAPPLTGEFTSPSHGYSIAVPEGWTTRTATQPWTTEYVDFFNESGDLLVGGDGQGFVALASQPLGDRTPEAWQADVWQFVASAEPEQAGCEASAVPITIGGATGVIACDLVLVASGGRGYWIRDFLGDDPPWDRLLDRAYFDSILATLTFQPEDAIELAASPSPS